MSPITIIGNSQRVVDAPGLTIDELAGKIPNHSKLALKAISFKSNFVGYKCANFWCHMILKVIL